MSSTRTCLYSLISGRDVEIMQPWCSLFTAFTSGSFLLLVIVFTLTLNVVFILLFATIISCNDQIKNFCRLTRANAAMLIYWLAYKNVIPSHTMKVEQQKT